MEYGLDRFLLGRGPVVRYVLSVRLFAMSKDLIGSTGTVGGYITYIEQVSSAYHVLVAPYSAR